MLLDAGGLFLSLDLGGRFVGGGVGLGQLGLPLLLGPLGTQLVAVGTRAVTAARRAIVLGRFEVGIAASLHAEAAVDEWIGDTGAVETLPRPMPIMP